ncbi:OB-fold domain-containing protein [Streptomyces sp. NPDC004539]|uniref:bifunctional MaoC family dehydratase N-terminal/OB-fold nucleic acid binding domain-containing protein n=1 Tax=Streptomyces sp. NPDC004539 TaxID=3154280 RepID=UPI0033A782E5
MPEEDVEQRLKAYEGRPAAVAGLAKDPVDAAMIRHWCEALGDTNPAYAGPDAIVPPAMLQVWTMGGLSGNSARTDAYEQLLSLLDELGCTAVVATDSEQEYVRPLRLGERVAFDSVIESVSGRKSTKLGWGYFVTTRTDVRGEDGELAGTHRFRILKYTPVESRPADTPAADSQAVDTPRRPRPVVNRDNSPFWQGIRDHRLLIQRCTRCTTLRLPWIPGCVECGSPDWDTVEADGEGTVYSYVVMHHPPFPAFDPPYAVALIQLAEGVRLVSNVIGVPYDKVRIGTPVTLEFHEYDEELTLPVFRAGEEPA